MSTRTRPIVSRRRRAGRLLAVAALFGAASLVACNESPLTVNDPTVLTPEKLSGPTAVPTRLNGAIRAFADANNSYIRYESYITDEMIATGTITDRTEVDFRDVPANDVTLTNELYEPMQMARQVSEDLVREFQSHLQDASFADVKSTLQQGIALGNLYAGYTDLMFGEFYCRSVIDSLGPDVSSDEAVQTGIQYLSAAEKAALDYGVAGVADAARVGQARGLVWLGDYQAAADTASAVSTGFNYQIEYSSNTPAEGNALAQFTLGVGGPDIRWTVGDGTAADRDKEKFTYFDEWVRQGLIQPRPPGLLADDAALPVNLQLLYTTQAANTLLATGWEARMIEAENDLRAGNTAQAQAIVNGLLTDPTQADNPMLAINPSLTQPRDGGQIPAMAAFDSVTFTGDLSTDLPQLARAREAGLWLSGTRQGTLRRLKQQDGIDLYPVRRGTDVCLPIPEQEVDNNPNVGG